MEDDPSALVGLRPLKGDEEIQLVFVFCCFVVLLFFGFCFLFFVCCRVVVLFVVYFTFSHSKITEREIF